MRVLALFTATTVAICGIGCEAVLGIQDPTPDFGGDGGPRTLVSIAIGPDPLSLPLGVCQQLTATGTFDDGSSEDITAETEFSAEAGGGVAVSPTGFARAVAEGPARVTAKIGRIEGNATAQVGAALPDRLAFSIGDFRVAQLQRVRFHAIVMLEGGAMQDATATATYDSDNLAAATIPMPGQIDAGAQEGAATISACLANASGGTVIATVTPKQCRPVINEFQAGGATGSDEWIEVLNPCTAPIDVEGWTIAYRGPNTIGGNDDNLMMTLTGQLMPGELRLYAGQDFPGQNDGKWPNATGIMGGTNGAVALRDGLGAIVDSVAYGTVAQAHPFREGATPLPAMVNGRSAQRLPFDGRDDDDGAVDFMQVMTASPRAFNAP